MGSGAGPLCPPVRSPWRAELQQRPPGTAGLRLRRSGHLRAGPGLRAARQEPSGSSGCDVPKWLVWSSLRVSRRSHSFWELFAEKLGLRVCRALSPQPLGVRRLRGEGMLVSSPLEARRGPAGVRPTGAGGVAAGGAEVLALQPVDPSAAFRAPSFPGGSGIGGQGSLVPGAGGRSDGTHVVSSVAGLFPLGT